MNHIFKFFDILITKINTFVKFILNFNGIIYGQMGRNELAQFGTFPAKVLDLWISKNAGFHAKLPS